MIMNLASRAKSWSMPVVDLSGAQLNAMPVPNKLVFAHPVFGGITLCPGDATVFPAMSEEIALTIAGERITLRCQRPIVAAMLQRAGHTVEKLALQADAQLAALVLEHLTTPALEELEAAYDTEIKLLTVRRAEPDPEAKGSITRLQVTADFWPAVVCVELQARNDSGDVILRRIFERLLGPPSEPPLHLKTQVQLFSPDFHITLAEAQALTPGDALMLDDRWVPTNEAHLGIVGHFTAPVAWTGNRLHLTGALRPPKTKDTNPMIADETEMETVFAIEDLPVTLTLELDRIELPFSAIAGLKAGSVLPFGTPMPETVRVLINGRPFATAGLVQIDNRLGIRIAAMTGKPV
jgi:type III secretion system YscQ/HrcQ family protein